MLHASALFIGFAALIQLAAGATCIDWEPEVYQRFQGDARTRAYAIRQSFCGDNNPAYNSCNGYDQQDGSLANVCHIADSKDSQMQGAIWGPSSGNSDLCWVRFSSLFTMSALCR